MHSGFSHSPFEMTGNTLKIVATPTSPTLQPPPRPPENSPLWQRKHSEYRYNGPYTDPDTGVTDPGYRPGDVDYLSGIITSYDSFKMTHGYVEAKAKLPAGQGLWPAFWMLPTHYVENVPEIDVMEFLGHDPTRLYNTYHFFRRSGRLEARLVALLSGRSSRLDRGLPHLRHGVVPEEDHVVRRRCRDALAHRPGHPRLRTEVHDPHAGDVPDRQSRRRGQLAG